MENKIQIQILNQLLEINNDRAVVYSLVKNEIIYKDLKIILAACIQNSLKFKAQLAEEKKRIISRINYKAVPNQAFLNVWLVINDSLSLHKRGRISSLFSESEYIFKTTYTNTLNEENFNYLTSRHKKIILKQSDLLKAS